jgi:hypothetical protein
LTWSIQTAAAHGTATASGTGTPKVISYSPTSDYNGSEHRARRPDGQRRHQPRL